VDDRRPRVGSACTSHKVMVPRVHLHCHLHRLNNSPPRIIQKHLNSRSSVSISIPFISPTFSSHKQPVFSTANMPPPSYSSSTVLVITNPIPANHGIIRYIGVVTVLKHCVLNSKWEKMADEAQEELKAHFFLWECGGGAEVEAVGRAVGTSGLWGCLCG
jgi:hypothetical protein